MLARATDSISMPRKTFQSLSRHPAIYSESSVAFEVRNEMRKLLAGYNSLKKVKLEDIVAFHASFERIHPFQDGNGRVGRLIAFKECLHHGIVPFIIEDAKKNFYYRGLANWDDDKSWLLDTCLDGQDGVKALLDLLEIET